MSKEIYESPSPITKSAAQKAFDSNDPRLIARGLVSASYFIDEWQWVQDQCLRFLNGSDQEVRKVAVVCLSHLARIHGELDCETVVPLLKNLRDDPVIGGEVAYSLEEIEWFLR